MLKSTKYQTLVGKPGEHDEKISAMLAEGWHLHGKPTAQTDGDLSQVLVLKIEVPDPVTAKTTQATVKPQVPVNPLPTHIHFEYGTASKGAAIDRNIAQAREEAIRREGRASDLKINPKATKPLVSLQNNAPRISSLNHGGATVAGNIGRRGVTTGPVDQRRTFSNPEQLPHQKMRTPCVDSGVRTEVPRYEPEPAA